MCLITVIDHKIFIINIQGVCARALPIMASTTLSPAQLCSGKSVMLCHSQQVLLVKPVRTQMIGKTKGMRIACQATSIPADRVRDMGKRQLMNLLLRGAISLPTAGMLIPDASFFAPPGSGSSAGGTTAKDAIGNDVIAEQWLKTHGPGDLTLTQGLKGDPTYLVVEQDRALAKYGINAVYTHLGCDVPWNAAENKFICPCHGSQYNDQGRVVRGPAPLSLALAHCDVDNGKVCLFLGLKQISEQVTLHGGLRFLKLSLRCYMFNLNSNNLFFIHSYSYSSLIYKHILSSSSYFMH